MSGDLWPEIRDIFERAIGLEADERDDFVEHACGHDPALFAGVRRLLAGHTDGDVFLARPLVDEGAVVRFVLGSAREASESAVTARFARAAVELRPGTVVGATYRVEGLLRAGGMGEVYRATHLHLARPVALKIVRAGLLDDRQAVERFEREARAVASLRHPHVVAVHDGGVDPIVGAYLALELLEGRTLAEEIAERGPLPTDDVVEIMSGVCAAVHAAHEHGLIHRDLKPSNVFLEATPDGVVAKVLDFGIAKLVGDEAAGTPLTRAGALIGTVAYMAPEQCRGLTVDRRADVYALGCVLYEMATGRRPFVGDGMVAVALKQVVETPAAPRSFAPDIPETLEAAIVRAMAKDPDDRFQTACELAEALLPGAPPAMDRAPVAPIGAVAPSSPTLPEPLARFVGRKEAVAELADLLRASRLLTLTGTGGVGKTRLAIETARRVLRDADADGVWFVELARLSDPAAVVRAAAAAVGVAEQAGRSTIESLARALRARRGLLVLDNCEHVLGACAELAVSLLGECPALRVLATSREPLGVGGERVWRVPSLAVPAESAGLTAASATESEAVRLFVDRAGLADRAFALTDENAPLVAAVCRRLDGIPLAIELAASRASALSVRKILERLDDRLSLLTSGETLALPRQQTLRGAIDWSHDLLDERERVLFRRLAAFVGGWTLEAAEAVCAGDGIDASDLLDVLTRLVKKSLVVVGRGDECRYQLLETIRAYACEKLVAAGEDAALLERHCDLYLAFAEEAGRGLGGAEQGLWARRIEAEHDNLRALLGRAAGRGDAERALRTCIALGNFWLQHGHAREGSGWFERSLAIEPRVATPDLGKALTLAGHCARYDGDFERASTLFEEALALDRTAGARESECSSLYAITCTLLDLGDYERASDRATECITLARELEQPGKLGIASDAMGLVAHSRGDAREAVRWFEEGLSVFRGIGSRHNTAVLLFNLAEAVHTLGGDVERERVLFEEGVGIAAELESAALMTRAKMGLGGVAAAYGRYAEAFALQAEALRVSQEDDSSLDIIYALEGIARTAAAVRLWGAALRLEAAAAVLRERARVIGFPHERRDLDRAIAPARGALAPDEAARERAAGRRMSVDEAVDDALALCAEAASV